MNLNEVVGELKPMLDRLLAGDIAFSFEGPTDLGWVTAESGQLGQVIVNLVVNARGAMPCGGTRLASARVLFMSGYADNESRSSDTGNDRPSFIQKPFTSDALARKVRAVLDR